ncbi:MAG TPA: YciI family protein [Candidatus Dormibacteraeota bacterium]|nr:YciI family protein [Candidatus Dormibacteraeota bacterium]
MKYVFLFCGTSSDQAAFDALTPEELKQRYAQVGRWFAENQGRLGHGNQLQGPDTGTTVRFDGAGKPIVKDGLFLEGKEIVGGYTEVEVPDLDAALTMAKTWPGGGTIEIRPVIQQR